MLSLCAHVTLLVNVVEDGEDRELLEASHTPHHPVRGWEPLMGRPTSTRGALDLELGTLDCIATILASGLGYKMLLQYSNKVFDRICFLRFLLIFVELFVHWKTDFGILEAPVIPY